MDVGDGMSCVTRGKSGWHIFLTCVVCDGTTGESVLLRQLSRPCNTSKQFTMPTPTHDNIATVHYNVLSMIDRREIKEWVCGKGKKVREIWDLTQQKTTRHHSSKTSKKITHHYPTHSTTHQHTQSNTNQKGSQRRGSNPRPVPDILLQDKRESLYRLSYEGNYVEVFTSGHDTIVTAF